MKKIFGRDTLRSLWRDQPAAAVLSAICALYLWRNLVFGVNDDTRMIFSGMLIAASLWAACSGMLMKQMKKSAHFSWIYAIAGGGIVLLFSRTEELLAWCGAAIALFLFFAMGKEKNGRERRLRALGGWLLLCALLAGAACVAFNIPLGAFGVLLQVNEISYLRLLLYCVIGLWGAPWLFWGGLSAAIDRAAGETDGAAPDTKKPARMPVFDWICIFLLLPGFLLLLAVLLIYILYILIRWEMPSGQMNAFGLLAFSAFTAFTLLLSGRENRLTSLFKKYGALPMIPVLATQTVGVVIRMNAYGLTTARLCGIALGLLFTGVLVCTLLRKRSDWFLPAAAFTALLLLISPFGAEHLSRLDQEARLRGTMEKYGIRLTDEQLPEELPEEALERMTSAAQWLYRCQNAPADSLAAKIKGGGSGIVSELLNHAEKGTGLAYFSADSAFSADETEVSGFSRVKTLTVRGQLRDNEWTADIDGETVGLTALILPALEGQRTLTAEECTLLLPSGKELRVTSVSGYRTDVKVTYVTVSAWLMIP